MKDEHRNQLSLFSLFGEWNNIGVSKGLVERIKIAWKKPFADLTNEELAALLRQRFAVEYILPLARQRIIEECNDDSEKCDGELEDMVEQIDKNRDTLTF